MTPCTHVFNLLLFNRKKDVSRSFSDESISDLSICVYSICALEGTWEKIITQLSYIGKIFLLSKPPSASTIHVIKNLSPPTDKKHMQFDNNDEISTLLNTVLSLVLNLSEIQIETTLQILFLCSAFLDPPMGKKFHTIFCI